ncbi:hypothetical protein Pa4123_72350 [Phytohabitans aurantiacus]|uniref:ESX-1 secretion-associated protein EspA/EspE-like domain-containing protein n=1 Tax=Phytohabitans aurantiacus TaxID=3016789 RepID=A0ABQ5R5X1_9ACTN|nr:hypothetical protein Pa4123_72350 [Phytohabitans aurantiacus]
MVTVTVPVVVVDFDSVLERVRRLVKEVRESAARVVERALSVARLLPMPVGVRLVQLAGKLDDLVRRLVELIERLSDPLGRPVRLWETGRRWVAEFGGPLSRHVGEIHPDHLAAGYEWDGRAAEAYEAAADRQRGALATLHGAAGEIDLALGRLALAICGMWAAVAAMLASAAVQLTAAALAAGTGAGVPAAVVLAVASMATLCGGIATGAGTLSAVIEWVTDSVSALHQRLVDGEAFPGGRWPGPSTERFRDGSMSDGSPSDWRLAD